MLGYLVIPQRSGLSPAGRGFAIQEKHISSPIRRNTSPPHSGETHLLPIQEKHISSPLRRNTSPPHSGETHLLPTQEKHISSPLRRNTSPHSVLIFYTYQKLQTVLQVLMCVSHYCGQHTEIWCEESSGKGSVHYLGDTCVVFVRASKNAN